jgi:DNA topoisomerase-1
MKISSNKISKIFKTNGIFDILPVNRWWEKNNLDLDKHDEEDVDEDDEHKNGEKDSANESEDEEKKKITLINGKDGKKFDSLEHNGVLFPQAYRSHGVKIKYNDEPIELTSNVEEIATFWATVLDNELSQKEIARKNFFKEFKNKLRSSKPEYKTKFENAKLEEFDFSPIYEYLIANKNKGKSKSTEEKKEEKEKKAKLTEIYGLALVDGFGEKISNYMVEPPGIYRRRGDHPGSGKLKERILPEDVTINVGPDNPVPICNLPGHNWKTIINNTESTWLAMYKEDKHTKYVFLAGNSKFKGMNDMKKYEKARKLKNLIDKIREDYFNQMKTSDTEKQQLGVATYLIDRLALRVGNEKGDDEADTVGCCSLRVEHIELTNEDGQNPNLVTFEFLGKDSMKYHNTVELDPLVVKLLRKFKRAKKTGDDLFEMINVSKLYLFVLFRLEN